ncbi:uncharacterized protein LOC141599977 [Silene latifolia]|uniref:uncharacterized protein LOC141599977 n=1 Tax=Silene latifolia TaxID=37657 RepID=UPI003D78348D
MSRKRNVVDRRKFEEKMSTYMKLMGYNVGDYKLTAAKELSRRIWTRDGRLSKKRMRRLQHLLCVVDSPTLLEYTVSVGKLVWRDRLMMRRMVFEKKLSEKIKQRRIKKKKRRGKPGRVWARRRVCGVVKKQNGRKRKVVVPKFVTGFRMRPVRGSNFRIMVRRKVTRKHVKAAFGSLMYRLAMAMNVLCYRNVFITSEWEFWTICLVQKICGFWRSVAIADGLSSAFASTAKSFGLCVVSSGLLERMESNFAVSTSACYLGSR